MRLLFILAISISLIFADSHLDLCQDACELPLTATTFNAYMGEDSPQRFPRALALFQQFQDTQSEIGNPIIRRAFLSALPERLSYSYSGQDSCVEGCVLSDLTPIRECVNGSNCSTENFSCIFEACGELVTAHNFISLSQLLGLEDSCQVCLGGHHNTTFEETLNLCEETANTTSTCTLSVVANLIVSAYPFVEYDYISFNDSRRGLLYARSELPSEQALINTVCAHFSVVTDREAQVNETLSLLQQTVEPSELVFLMGDFNIGPQLENITAVENETYSFFLESLGNYSNIYYQFATDPLCTSCPENPLREVEEPTLIDYVLVRDSELDCVVEVSRVFTEPVVNGTEGAIPISDHYGVSVTICPTLPEINSTTPTEATQTVSPTVYFPDSESARAPLKISTTLIVISLLLSVLLD